jgi:peptide/nickel transport system permease protein
MTADFSQPLTPAVARRRSPRRLRLALGLTPSAIACLSWLTVVLGVALLAHWLAPYDYEAIDLRARLQPPVWMEGGTWQHWLGTDDLGRDVYSRLLHSVRMSLLVAVLGTIIGAVLGTTLGFLAAHFRGWIEDLVVMAIDFQAALPFMILALAVIAFFDNSLVLFIAIMGIYGWERYARITRGMTLSALGQGYALSLQVLGVPPLRIYLRHILPNIASVLIVNLTLTFPAVILMETSLSFLGLGIQPPQTSLGNMVGFGRDYLMTAWWIAVLPSAVIFLTTLALCLLGDWLRDRLDPMLDRSPSP